MPALRRELERKKVRFSKNDGKDQLQAKLEAVLKLETCPPTCPLTRGEQEGSSALYIVHVTHDNTIM